jgi:hypothetical protein
MTLDQVDVIPSMTKFYGENSILTNASTESAVPEPQQTAGTAGSQDSQQQTVDLTIDEYVKLLAAQGGEPGTGLEIASVQSADEQPEIPGAESVTTEAELPVEPLAAEFYDQAGTLESSVKVDDPQFVDQFKLPDELQPAETGDADSVVVHNDNKWLFSRNPGRATFQLVRIKDRKMALNLYADLDSEGKLFSTVSDHYRWYFILLGDFSDLSSAESNQGGLPEWALNPALRSFREVQKERCDQAGLLEPDEAAGLSEFCRP